AVGAYLSWGLGFVIGPIFLRRLRTYREIEQPYLVAAGYAAALAVIPAGLTVTVPLLINTPGHFMVDQIGLIPLSETIFAPTLVITATALLISMFALFMTMQPRDRRGDLALVPEQDHGSGQPVSTNTGEAQEVPFTTKTPAEKFDTNRPIAWVIAALGLSVVIMWFVNEGLNLDINFVNFAFLFIGIALHGNLSEYISAFTEGVKSASAVILQFPFYAGIMGMV